MSHKKPYTFSEYTPPQFEQVRDRNQQFEDDVIRNKLSGARVLYQRDTSYMTFPNTLQEIEEILGREKSLEKKKTLGDHGHI